jgi:hypothetical protein
MSRVYWETTTHGWTADVDALWLCISGPDADDVWAWEVNASPDEESVRGEAYTEEFAKLYAEACAKALLCKIGHQRSQAEEERAAVVAWLRALPEMDFEESLWRIERGEHRREEEK